LLCIFAESRCLFFQIHRASARSKHLRGWYGHLLRLRTDGIRQDAHHGWRVSREIAGTRRLMSYDDILCHLMSFDDICCIFPYVFLFWRCPTKFNFSFIMVVSGARRSNWFMIYYSSSGFLITMIYKIATSNCIYFIKN